MKEFLKRLWKATVFNELFEMTEEMRMDGSPISELGYEVLEDPKKLKQVNQQKDEWNGDLPFVVKL